MHSVSVALPELDVELRALLYIVRTERLMGEQARASFRTGNTQTIIMYAALSSHARIDRADVPTVLGSLHVGGFIDAKLNGDPEHCAYAKLRISPTLFDALLKGHQA